jgi:hypothetical protein
MRDTREHLTIADALQEKIKTLHSSIWERRADWPMVQRWLAQFGSDEVVSNDEQLQALFLLSNFIYFGTSEIRALLKSLYRDLFRPRIARAVREAHGDTSNLAVIEPAIQEQLTQTRFVALGNPSESSAMLLYFFRQENLLPKDLFISASDVFRLTTTGSSVNALVQDSSIIHYVFIDDLCGSGQQGMDYSKATVEPLKAMNPDAKTYYYSLFGLSEGVNRIRRESHFDVVSSVVELDESFKAFSATSRVYARAEAHFDRLFGERMCSRYGAALWPSHPLGFRNGQLMIGFSHNTPDNTLPIFWSDQMTGAAWTSIFKRFPKVYW